MLIIPFEWFDLSLKEKIEQVAEGLKGTLGVAVKQLGTSKEVTVRGNTVFQLASVFKVPVIVTLYRQADAGKIDLDNYFEMTDYERVPGSGVLKELTPGLKLKIRDYRTLMMMISDNTAADTIVNLVGKENVNNTMLELGLKETRISTCRDILFELVGLSDIDPKDMTIELWNEALKKMRDKPTSQPSKESKVEMDNVSTPRDMMVLLEKVYKGEAASRGSCDEIIELMKKCQTGENRIWRHLPRDRVEVAHKTGTISDVVNDVGIVFPKGKAPYILCVFTKDIVNEGKLETVEIGEEAIAKVSKIAYEYFTA